MRENIKEPTNTEHIKSHCNKRNENIAGKKRKQFFTQLFTRSKCHPIFILNPS